MATIRHILVPVDFSTNAADALRYAAVFSARYGSRVTVMHVVRPIIVPLLAVSTAAAAAGVREAAHDHVAAALRRFVCDAGLDDATMEFLVTHGDPARCIVKQALAMKSVVVVMGTHGRSGFDRALLGSTTEKVLRQAWCPVLTVPATAVKQSHLPLKRLLCATDFSAAANAACTLALSIARESNAHLTLLHVVHWPVGAEDPLAGLAPRISDFRESLENAARQRLHRVLPAVVDLSSGPSFEVEHGEPDERIVAAAAIDDADLIVMGVHGRSLLHPHLFGSTAAYVVRHAGCPVLTLRAQPSGA